MKKKYFYNENDNKEKFDLNKLELLSNLNIENKYTRRDFLRKLQKFGIAGFSLPLIGNIENIFAATSTISVVQGEDPEKVVEKAINIIGGMSKFIKRGDIVTIKPNIGWDRNYRQAANTNPFVVKKVIEMCLNAGAKKVRVTDNPCQAPSLTFVRSGIKKVCDEMGAELIFPGENLFKDIKIGGRVVKNWPVYIPIIETDKLINIPVAKHHGLSKLTLGMKNFYGAVGGSRGRLHQDIHGGIVDLARFFKPDLTIIDAIRIMLRNGPTGGSLSDVKKIDTVIAGVDYVSCDAYATTFFGLKPEQIGYVKMAGDFKLGVNNLKNINAIKANI